MRKELLEFLQDLIDCYAVQCELDLTMIDEIDKQKLVAFCIEDDNRDLTYCLIENEKYDDIISSFIKCLKTADSDDIVDFSTVLVANLFNYYKPRCQAIIKEKLDDMWREGKESRVCPETGEVLWSSDR